MNTKKPIVYMISGYRRTGKDTLYGQLNTGQCLSDKWIVYANPNISDKQFPVVTYGKILRISFSDLLKKSVASMIPGLENKTVEELDLIKEDRIFTDPWNIREGLVSLRDLYIDEAKRKRDCNPDHWVKLAFDTAIKNGIDLDSQSIGITDFRYPNELTYLKRLYGEKAHIITVRVFRSVIPRVNDQSEISLDQFKCDYVLIGRLNTEEQNKEEFQKLVTCLPQYSDYVHVPSVLS